MWNTFRRTALAVALLAGTVQLAQAQPHPSPAPASDPNTSTTVLHGTPGEGGAAAEIQGFGSSTSAGYTTSAGGTTVFHGTPAGTPPPWPAPPPPWALPPPPAPGNGR
jgi:hypothetical protein